MLINKLKWAGISKETNTHIHFTVALIDWLLYCSNRFVEWVSSTEVQVNTTAKRINPEKGLVYIRGWPTYIWFIATSIDDVLYVLCVVVCL